MRGNPGTGINSLCRAIATRFGLAMYIISLATIDGYLVVYPGGQAPNRSNIQQIIRFNTGDSHRTRALGQDSAIMTSYS